MWNMIFLFASLVFVVLLFIVVYSKEIIDSQENKSFKRIIIASFFMNFTEIILQIFVRTLGVSNSYVEFLAKLYLIVMILWYSAFSKYVFIICLNKSKNEKYKKNIKRINITLIIITIITIVMLGVLKIEKFYELEKMYTYGPAVDILKLFIGTYMIAYTICLLINLKHIKDKKYLPIFVVLVLLVVSTILQSIDPSILIASMVATFICYTMYFTIENPDMKMLREIKKSRDFAEQSNTEKAMFLYNTSQEIKTPVHAIEERCEELLDTYELSDDLKEEIRDIKFAAKKLSTTISSVLDMSNSSKNTNIEIKIGKYNTKYLFKELVSISKVSMAEQNKNLDLRVNIDDSIPEYLMGDAIRLKEIIVTLINNAIKHTTKGFIEFNVSYVIKHNSCRLIISVEDSGCGIESSKLETLFYNTDDLVDEDGMQQVDNTKVSLTSVKILTNLIGGTIIVNSELEKGTKFTIVLDQDIYQEEKTTTDIAIEKLSANKKILVVDDDEESIKQITKVLNKYDVNVEAVLWGQDCLERIRKHQKYDLILLDEDMPRLNGIKTFEKLKLEENFNTPVVIMIDEKHLEYKDRYLINGFSGIIEKPVKKKDTDKIITKYIKVDE